MVSAPKTARVGQDFAVTVRLDRARDVGAFQVDALVGENAAQVVTAIPAVEGGRILDAANTAGSARVGFFNGNGALGTDNAVAEILVTPQRAGRLQVRLSTPLVVDRQGHRVLVRMVHSTVTVQVGTSKKALLAPHALKPRSAAVRGRLAHVARAASGDVAANISAWQLGAANVQVLQQAADHRPGSVKDLTTASSPKPRKHRSTFAATVWTVNTTDDLPDATPGDRICATSAGTCSLRAAIDEANRRKGDDVINFNIPGGAPQTIQLSSATLTINAQSTATASNTLTIDGYSEPGAHPNTDPVVSNALPGITISGLGATLGSKVNSIYITSANNVIRGLAFANAGRDINIYGANASGNKLIGNFFGMDALGNRSAWDGGFAGVMIDGAANNQIGTPDPADRNVVAGHFDGYIVDNPGANGNVFYNNLIGVSPDGTQPYGGSCTGIDFNVGPKNNIVGGTAPGQRNVIDAYGCDGTEWSHGWNQSTGDSSVTYQVNDNFTIGNYIGFKPDGSYDPNFVNAHGNTSNTNDGSAENMWDIVNHNTVQFNWMAAAQNAVQIAQSANNNIVTDNHMGVAPNGDDAAMGFDGVRIRGTSSGNQILRNVIRNAGQAGVSVNSFNDRNNLISQNSISSVGTLGIDLAPTGAVNPNDVNDVDNGPNTLQNFPVITSVSTTTVSGTSNAANSTVELFRTRFGLPGENGPAETFIASVKTNAAGAWTMTGLTLSPGDVLTTTNITSTGNTSELGTNVAVPGAAPNVQGVTYDDFQGYGGTNVNDIPEGTAPTHTGRVANFQSPIDRGDNLGTRLRAYVTPPTTGDYTFWISSDDASQLFLSLDGNTDHRLPIASISGWVPQGHYDDVATQKSGTFTLQAGQKYYLEAYAKEGGGEDHLEVAWSGPGISRQVIKSQYLSPTNDGCSGWCPNYVPAGHGVQYDDYQGYGGTALTDIPQGTAPTASSVLAGSFQSPVDRGDNNGTRLRALLTVPATGTYTFWVASDDNSGLFLSSSSDPANETEIASVPAWAPYMTFDWYASQQSAQVTLTAGQQYFIEGYAKEGGGGDHLEVAWSGPGFGRTLIPAAFITPTTTGCSGWCPNYVYPGHGIQFDDFQGFPGINLTDIPQGTASNSSTVLQTGLISPINRGDNLGTRLRAILTAPATGSYTFWVASDDAGAVYLSPSTDPSQAVKIARVDGHTGLNAYDDNPTQMSSPITLTAGQKYYIEAYTKEGGGEDFVQVAWSGPGFARTLVPGNVLTPTTTGCAGWCPLS